jgi:hypothetical protein
MVAEETELDVATVRQQESLLLDIGIVEFDAGIPEDNEPAKTRIYESIRSAESRYLAYHLKSTLQETGHWGAVRVVPSTNAFTDVWVAARIARSDGEFVTLDVTVRDAIGQTWLRRSYATQTGMSSYSDRRDRRLDPYQKVFNDIANDLRAHVATLPPDYLKRVREVSELQFFADMAPVQYSQHLTTDEDGIVSVMRLPAENDPTVMRLRQIRERDRLVIDMLNEHYANFYYGIAIPYRGWRKVSREEAVNYRQVKRSAQIQGLVGVVVLAGSLAAETDNSSSSSKRRMARSLQGIGIREGLERIIGGVTRSREANMHLESIAELSESFGSEAAPMVINVAGQTRRLTGTATAQYESWRRLLRDIYEAETGFRDDIEVGAPVRAPEPGG